MQGISEPEQVLPEYAKHRNEALDGGTDVIQLAGI